MDDFVNDVHHGDAARQLRKMPADSVHMAMCSPPYFGLRDYGVDGQIGLEDSLDEYIESLVDVGQELRRVLRDDGSWWLNLGDTYSGGSIVRSDGEWTRPGDEGYEEAHTATTDSDGRRSISNLGRKNKMLVPHRVAIALQKDGWVVRNDVTWVKPNPMPTSAKDRLNTTTEKIFHLTPAPDYWYDLDAIREPHKEESLRRSENGFDGSKQHDTERYPDRDDESWLHNFDNPVHPNGKNPGDVFSVTVKPFPDAHFAVYPPELCEKPIRASCPPEVCAECGTGYERDEDGESWSSACDCESEESEPGIVLDPFAGAGTTLLKAKDLGRFFVGIELSEEYVSMAQHRVGLFPDNPRHVFDEGQSTLFEDVGEGDG